MSYFSVFCMLGFVSVGFFVFRLRYSSVVCGEVVIFVLFDFMIDVRLLGFRLCVVLMLLFFSSRCWFVVLGMWCSMMCFIVSGSW